MGVSVSDVDALFNTSIKVPASYLAVNSAATVRNHAMSEYLLDTRLVSHVVMQAATAIAVCSQASGLVGCRCCHH